MLRGTVERYLCDCPSSGRPLFCYNHVSARLRGCVIYRHAAFTVPTPRTDPGCELRNRGWASSGTQKRGAERCGRVFRPWRAYYCTRNGNDVLIDPPLFCWPGRLPDRAGSAMYTRYFTIRQVQQLSVICAREQFKEARNLQ